MNPSPIDRLADHIEKSLQEPERLTQDEVETIVQDIHLDRRIREIVQKFFVFNGDKFK